MRINRAIHRWAFLYSLALLGVACAGAEEAANQDYLALWVASADSTQPDFLAVLDVTANAERYGDVVTTLPVPGLRNGPHHTEHEMPASAQLFANGFGAGKTWVFDLQEPRTPRIAAAFEDFEGYTHPHSFLRLPNGNVLATYQMRHVNGDMQPGGLVEITDAGARVRSSSAFGPGIAKDHRVYSAQILPALDRIVTTSTDMHDAGGVESSRLIQVWRLSDLALLHSFPLPPGPLGDEGDYTAEPRVMADGRTVLVSTFNCGLYLMDGIEGDAPSARFVASFPKKPDTYCAIPVIIGHYYLVTVPAWSAVVVLDIADPAAPREVGRMALGDDDVPHWIAASPDGSRIVVTGYGAMRNRVVLADFDTLTGALTLDSRFRDAGAESPGVRLDNKSWPHGGTAAGVPHGAVFTRR
ncbi:MAG: hypothetical protein KF709_12005 [Gemmatimonadaceae bacterium]|nr:hypothetical protein [Gemmatimonadaceae bacterium]